MDITPTMKKVLLSLSKSPKKDSELLATIPNLSLELLGRLRDLEYIDHYDNLVYITSRGESIIKNV